MQTIRQAEFRLLDVTTERSVYQGELEEEKSSVVPYFTKDSKFFPLSPASQRPANRTPISALWRSRCFTPMTPPTWPNVHSYTTEVYNFWSML